MAPTANSLDYDAADENTPLIAAASDTPRLQNGAKAVPAANGSTETGNDNSDFKPLPRAQIFLLCYACMIEPIAFFCIFPFVNQMIKDTGNLNEAEVGFYSGWIESLFSLTQMLVMVPWGRLADRIGRKPVLVTSLCGCSISMALFGFSEHIWQMIMFRCLAGVFAGSVLTVRSMITENSTPKTQARAFSFFSFAQNIGIFLAPLLGGFLADPATQFPSMFKGIRFVETYPYALATLAIGIFGASAILATVFFVKETLGRKTDDGSKPERHLSTIELLKSPGVGRVLWSFGMLMLIALAYTAVLTLFWFTSPELGGFGLSPFQISFMLAIGGCAQAVWLLLAFPWLHERLGTRGTLRFTSYAMPIVYILSPLFNVLLRYGNRTLFWILAPPCLCLGSGIAMGFTAAQLAVNNVVPSHRSLGTINALALSLTSGIRAVAPAMFTSIFATGVKHQIVWGYLFWVVLSILAIVYSVGLHWLPANADAKMESRNEQENRPENEN